MMPDIVTITAVLNSLKTATDIAKFLRESDLSFEQAELKLKLADLVGALADAKLELAEVQETLAEKNERIADLEDAFEAKGAFVRCNDAYYMADEDGNPTGVPHCLRCWETDHRKRQLVRDSENFHKRVCTACGHRYEGRLAGDMRSPKNAQTGQN